MLLYACFRFWFFHEAAQIMNCIGVQVSQLVISMKLFNPYLTNGFSHHYQLDESTFISRGVRSDFQFLSHFFMKFLQANRIAPDGTPRSACPCPIKRTPGSNELIIKNNNIYCFIFIFLHFNYKSTLHIFKNNTFSITVHEQ